MKCYAICFSDHAVIIVEDNGESRASATPFVARYYTTCSESSFVQTFFE